MSVIGIRHEDKSRHERRIPLVGEDMEALHREAGITFWVQKSPQRVFVDSEFVGRRGVELVEDLQGCPVILGVKEIPVHQLQPETTYVFFSHTIKGQAQNMPMLRRLMELSCTLLDYECIVDGQGRRQVAFGVHAGMAGAIDSLWALGQRWATAGVHTPLTQLRPAHTYGEVADALAALSQVSAACRRDDAFRAQDPVVLGVTGGGRVAQGAHRVLDALSPLDLSADALGLAPSSPGRFVRVAFDDSHLVEANDGSPFCLNRYLEAPEAFRPIFEARYARHLTVLIHGIYWEPKYPRVLTKAGAKDPGRLQVVGDVSCDIEGSIEYTVRATDPDAPTFVYDPEVDQIRMGFEGNGVLVMAVDILPTELPRDASRSFSQALKPHIRCLAEHDFRRGVDGLPQALRRAVIVDRGRLAPDYAYLAPFVEA